MRQPDVATEAATWYARLHADDVTSADRLAFDVWLAADNSHAHAWNGVSLVSRTLEVGRDDPALFAIIAAARGGAPVRQKSWWPMAAAAAAALAIIGTATVTLNAPSRLVPTQVADVSYITSIGQARDIRLPDGTIMTLDAASAVRVSAPGSTRQVLVARGQAFFKVAHDAAHPFMVSANGNRVTALGTEFAVRIVADRMVVSLIEGSVRVEAPAIGRTTTLAPGNTLTIGPSGLQLTVAGADNATGWRKGLLTFDSTPLSEVVADLNRYSKQRIEISDPRLARRVFSGVLKTDGGGLALADALSAYGIAYAKSVDDEHLILAPR